MSKENNTDPSGDPKDPKTGDPSDPKDGNPSPDDIKNLQRKLSDNDLKLKDAEKNGAKAKQDLDDFKKKQEDKRTDDEKKFDDLKIETKKLTDEVAKMNTDKRKVELAKNYPDILPDLLVGKTDEQVEKIAEKQRAIAKKIYGDAKAFVQPTYESEGEIDKEIDEVKKDKGVSGENAAVKILNLTRNKLNFKKK